MGDIINLAVIKQQKLEAAIEKAKQKHPAYQPDPNDSKEDKEN